MRLERELEAQLVVPLARAAVHDRFGAQLERDLGDRLRDHRPRERRDERVLALVQRVREDGPRALLVGECVLAIDEEDVVGVSGLGPRDRLLEVELLADVDEHGDDLLEAVPLLLQPREDAARVEPARVGDDRGSRHGYAAPWSRCPASSSRSEWAEIPSRAATKIVLSPAIVPAIAGWAASSTACARALA